MNFDVIYGKKESFLLKYPQFEVGLTKSYFLLCNIIRL